MTSENKPKVYSTAIVPATVQPAAIAITSELETSIQGFSSPLAGFLGSLGLPTENVFVEFGERRFVLQSLLQTLDVLPYDERAKAFYLTKFSVSVMVGLFDAALNFLWDEAILALRRLAVGIDLSYFFDTAEKREGYRSRLQTEEDLKLLDDFTLIDTCARVGLLTDVNRERLRHVNYMRNHASAAHPNQSELTGQEMVAWLSNCLRYAITAKPDHAVIATKQLLTNVRGTLIPEKDIPVIASDFEKFTVERVDDLLWTLFGIYVDPSQKADCRTNISKLAPHVWALSSEDRKFHVGARHEHFIKQADQQRKTFADEFLAHVNGQQYRAESVLVGELLDKLRSLHAAHNALNNFYNEWPHAKSLASSLPVTGVVPRAARLEWVKIITKCHIGNGQGYYGGVDTTADRHYRDYIGGFGEAEAVQFLRLFEDPDFTVDFDSSMAHLRARALASTLKSKTKNVHVLRALDVLLEQPEGVLRKLSTVAKFREALKNLPKPAA
jgi:hypothetical protein